MLIKKDTAIARPGVARDPFSLLRDMSSEMERMFDQGSWPTFRWPSFALASPSAEPAFTPAIDVFEKDNRLVTRVDLPGLKKEDVKVEVSDGALMISGERKSEVEEKKDDYYRCERNYGSFYRAVPLPKGVKFDDINATFNDGVLEVSVPLPTQSKPDVRTVAIAEGTKPSKAA